MKHVWLDVDPGHDDAMAILLAVHCPNIKLLGVSTTHGNAEARCTASNAGRCLIAYGAPEHIRVYPGAEKPLLRPPRHDPEIHGIDGLGGVVGLPPPDDPLVLSRFAKREDGTIIKAIEGMADSIRSICNEHAGQKVTVISCGPMTNIALFVSIYPELVDYIEELVFMGGGVGIGNRSAVAEFNILCDPEAAQIVLDVPMRKVMIPLNVTHKAIVTEGWHAQMLLSERNVPTTPGSRNQTSPLRLMLSSIISFFSESYRSTFGFTEGPPLHDALTIAFVAHAELFKCERYRVDVELQGAHTTGETVVDVWKYRSCDDSWGPNGRNCLVAQDVDIQAFFRFLLDCIKRCDQVSPLNK